MKALYIKSTKLSVFLLSLLIIGCSANSNEENSANEDATSGNETYFSLPNESLEVHNSEELNFSVQTVVEGLEIPWGVAFLPNGNVLITERDNGTLRLVRDGVLVEDPIAGVPESSPTGQGGLLDVELHPNYGENGWIYITYSKPGEVGQNTALIRARYDEETHSLTDLEELFAGTPTTEGGAHFGGRLVFDHDGYLYTAIGDRGRMNTAQDITNSHGNLYRFNDDGSIPSDNPFVGSEGMDEIYSYGHRNIQGMDVHPVTGIVWTNEHGPRGGDELNVQDKPGANYGWPEISYGINYDGTTFTDETEREGMEQPVTYWDPSIAPSGLAFVSSDLYAAWNGNVLNGALAFQLISRVVLDGDEFVREERLLEGIGRIREVEQGPDGYIYFTNESDGTLNRIIPVE
tara:strand:+ start:4227 stop:5438 length:1212 start_codon:yes stop_codon:yes gene_type:complete